MFKIEKNKLNNYNQYITEYSSIYFSCILNGTADGIIWGDKKENPNFLLVWSPYQEGFQLMGKPIPKDAYQSFRIWFRKIIISFLQSVEMDYFEYGSDSEELFEMIKDIFTNVNIKSAEQKIFTWSESKNTVTLPQEYQVRKIDREFFLADYIDTNYIVDELIRAYGSLEHYFSQGVAYVCILSNKIIARADMLFNDSGYGNISVDTKEAHRKKGISSYLAIKVIEETRKLGLIPIWDCTEDNIASEKTAIKCGFRQIRTNVISWFMLHEVADMISTV